MKLFRNLQARIEQLQENKPAKRLNSSELENLYLQGYAKYQANDWEGCIEDMSILIEQDPGNVVYYIYRSLSNSNLNCYDAAMDDVNNGLRLDPNGLILHHMRGVILGRREQYAEAIENYSELISLDPEDNIAYSLRGQMFKALGDYLSAASDFQTRILLVAADGDNEIIFDPEVEEFPELDKASPITIAGNWIEPKKVELFAEHALLAIEHFKNKEYEAALSELTIAHNINPAHEVVFNVRCLIFDDRQDLENGIANLTEKLQFFPDDAETRINLGILRSMAGQNDEALAELSIASQLIPDSAKVWLYLGEFYLKIHECRQAIEHLTRCIELDPNTPDAYLYRAYAKEEMDNYLGAIPDLEIYFDLGGSSSANLPGLKKHLEGVKKEYGWEGSLQKLTYEKEKSARGATSVS